MRTKSGVILALALSGIGAVIAAPSVRAHRRSSDVAPADSRAWQRTSPQRHATPLKRTALNEDDVLKLLAARVPSAQIRERASREGIDFVVTEAVQAQLRKAGANDELIQTLRQIQPQGLVWGPAKRVVSMDHGFVDVSNLVTEDGKHYVVFTGDDKHVRLASDVSGTWKVYPVYSTTDVGNGAGQWYVGLAVQQGHVYISFVTLSGDKNVIAVAHSGNLEGTWGRAALYATDASYLSDPFVTIAGGSLLVSFDTPGPGKNSNDVFVASIPLSQLPATGVPFSAPLAAQIANVSNVDDVQGGPDDSYAEIVPDGDGLFMAWQRGQKTLVSAQGHLGGVSGTTWPQNAQLLHTATDTSEQSLQIAAANHTVVIGRFIVSPNRDAAPGCCDVWATTNASGGWTTEIIGRTDLALQKPGVAISACGPSVAFLQSVTGNSGRLTVATFAGGHWNRQSLAADMEQPRLAATPDGLDLIYKSGYEDISFQHAKCYPPPAPLQP